VIDFDTVFGVLVRVGVEFIVIGGAAATIHGSARITRNLDIVYRRTPEKLRRVVDALWAYSPYLRGAPAGLPFLWDADTLRRGLNFTLTTSLGDLDLLGEVTGGGNFEALLPHSSPVQAFGIECLSLNLDKLIQVKRAAGRPKDLEAIAELEALREERGKRD
jgi:predicted nucleotidyltransferase